MLKKTLIAFALASLGFIVSRKLYKNKVILNARIDPEFKNSLDQIGRSIDNARNLAEAKLSKLKALKSLKD